MAHEIDELAPGIHGFATARIDAWHRLGTTLDSTFDAQTALETAHLAGWDVRKQPIQTFGGDGEELTIKNRYATVRTNPVTQSTEVLGVVGSHYVPIQNESHVELLDALVDESGAHFETAGSLKGGRQTFVSMKMPEHLLIGGQDAVDMFLVAQNSHDGSTGFQFLVTPVRVVCANTLTAALSGAKAKFSVRHSGGAEAKLQEAREALGMTFAYVDAFQAEAEALIAKTLTDDRFKQIMQSVFGYDESKPAASRKRIDSHVAAVTDLYNTSETMEDLHGTAWGGYQALTEYVDHFMPVRGDSAHARANRAITSHATIQLKEMAFTHMQLV